MNGLSRTGNNKSHVSGTLLLGLVMSSIQITSHCSKGNTHIPLASHNCFIQLIISINYMMFPWEMPTLALHMGGGGIVDLFQHLPHSILLSLMLIILLQMKSLILLKIQSHQC